LTNVVLADLAPSEDLRPEAASQAFRPPVRIQASLVSASERKLLDALCRRMPAWITPDRLTAIGALGMVVAAIGYVGSNWRPAFLFVASLGLAVNWFGDSLDGSLARFRCTERPRYGYFVDHSVDAFGFLVFAVGLGLSPYVGMPAALMLACGYFLLTISVLLSAQVNGAFLLSRAYFGPTELRLVTIAFNGAVYLFGPVDISVAGFDLSLWSCLVMLEAAAFVAVFATGVFAAARSLRDATAD
jgi:archaetidylinositol phosphate synthase